MRDLIYRQAAIDAIDTWDKFGVDERCRIVRWHEGLEPYVHLRDVLTAIVNLPSVQPEQQHGRMFQEIVVEYPSSTYPEHEGKPYFSIKYTENGQGFIGYGTYKPEVLSEYLKEYFMPSAQPDMSEYSDKLWKAAYERGKAEGREKRKKGHWIPQDHNIKHGMITTTAYFYPKCSRCGNSDNYTNFCLKCGADMRG